MDKDQLHLEVARLPRVPNLLRVDLITINVIYDFIEAIKQPISNQ